MAKELNFGLFNLLINQIGLLFILGDQIKNLPLYIEIGMDSKFHEVRKRIMVDDRIIGKTTLLYY
jgi:ABC-type tungstate transport system substrate-binding protein